jgi:hypothetical protein
MLNIHTYIYIYIDRSYRIDLSVKGTIVFIGFAPILAQDISDL